MAYSNFDLRISVADENGRYQITAESPYGQTSTISQQVLPTDDEFTDLLSYLHDLVAHPEDARVIGKRLYTFLFPPTIQQLYVQTMSQAKTEGKKGIRIRLHIRTEQNKLNQIPWEYCHGEQQFLALNKTTPLVRYLPIDKPPEPITTPTPIRVLITSANPQNKTQLNTIAESANIQKILKPLIETGQIELKITQQTTRTILAETVRLFKPHIFHFIGHGELRNKHVGTLLLEDEANQAQAITVEELSVLFRNTDVKLVILNACHTVGTKANEDLIPLTIAPRLVHLGVPAAIGMQFAIPDKTAQQFSKTLYTSLAEGSPLDTAVTEARISCYFEQTDKLYWAIPVLYMRAPNGVLWRLSNDPPFMGLIPFHKDASHLFFGRKQLVNDLTTQLEQQRTLIIVGASGNGKSSLVQAGIVPIWQQRKKAVGEHWQIQTFNPGKTPLLALAKAVTRHHESPSAMKTLLANLQESEDGLDWYLDQQFANDTNLRILLIVDQFEELFTQGVKQPLQQLFVNNLAQAIQNEHNGRFVFIITMRSDFYTIATQFDRLKSLLETKQKILSPMTYAELQQAIEEPALRHGWQFEAGLVKQLLKDVSREPGALPLLSHALLETWKKRTGRTLTIAGYIESGRVQGAIAQTAKETYQALDPTEKTIARHIFMQLTQINVQQVDTRRQVTLAELLTPTMTRKAVTAVLEKLVPPRLIITNIDEQGETIVDLAHEALIHHWPALQTWLADKRQRLRWQQTVIDAAKEWQKKGHEPSYLYQGKKLKEAQAQVVLAELPPYAQTFLQASKKQQRRARWRRVATVATVTVLAVAIWVLIQRITSPWEIIHEEPALSLAMINNDTPIYYLATRDIGIARSIDGEQWIEMPSKGLPRDIGNSTPGKDIFAVFPFAANPTMPDQLLAYLSAAGSPLGLYALIDEEWIPVTENLPFFQTVFDLEMYGEWRLATLRRGLDENGSPIFELFVSHGANWTWASVTEMTCSDRIDDIPKNIIAIQFSENGEAVYLGTSAGLYYNELSDCWQWDQIATTPQVLYLAGTRDALYLATTSPDRKNEFHIYHWQVGGNAKLLTTVDDIPLALTMRPSPAQSAYLLLGNGDIIELSAIGETKTITQVSGRFTDLIAVPHPTEDRPWVLLAHEDGLRALKE